MFNDSVSAVLQNLSEVVNNELEHLNEGKQELLETFARRKMQLYRQLSILFNNQPDEQLSPVNKITLREVDELLRQNMEKLRFRIQAIDEISSTIEAAVREGESDGTYEAGSYRVSLKT